MSDKKHMKNPDDKADARIAQAKKDFIKSFSNIFEQKQSESSSAQSKVSFPAEDDGTASSDDMAAARLGGPESSPRRVRPTKKQKTKKETTEKKQEPKTDTVKLAENIAEIQDKAQEERDYILENQQKSSDYMRKLREKNLSRLKKKGAIEYLTKEIVIDPNGSPRQAGSNKQDGEFIEKMRSVSEKSLYFFLKGILNRFFLTNHFHKDVCQFLNYIPPFRKLVLMPREHAKTAIVSGGLPLHILIQPADTNLYFPGLSGSECRIMLAGENMRMSKKNLRVLQTAAEENQLLKALWPTKFWDQPRREAKTWNADALIFPRKTEWPDPTMWAIGVDGAITGARPNVMIKDDLVTEAAAGSSVEMEAAIQWHRNSRALLDSYEIESGLQSLEFIIGTRWAVYDLYSEIIDNDLSVEVIDKKYWQIVRDGKILWPEKHTLESIAEIQREHQHMFFLLYMNNANDPMLTDFDLNLVREFKLISGNIMFERLEEDLIMEKLAKNKNAPAQKIDTDFVRRQSGVSLTPELMDEFSSRVEYLRFRST